MIHGAKLLNKNKTHKVTFAKNKKNQKKNYIKIENWQRSIRRPKKGVWSNICPNTQKRPIIQTQDARHAHVLCKLGKNTGHIQHEGQS